MASHWTSKNAILRDLSVAQGREVPVEFVEAVTSDEKPPALNYTEETEEEFYADCVGSGDFNAGPDLKLIQQMLDMVREVEIKDIDEDSINTEMILEISKANAQFISEEVATKEVVKKLKKNRNVAMESLLETYGDGSCNGDSELNSQGPKLLKPDDFMSSTQTDQNDMNNLEKNNVTSNKIPIITSPVSMFKKKTPNRNSDTSMFQKKTVSPTTKKDNDVSENKPRYFVPSSHAGERYKAYLEKSKLQEQVKEDIWARAERQMKEIDAKRREDSLRNEMTQSSSSQDSDKDDSELKGMDFVRLPQHRHLLTGDCTVCKVLCTHRKDEVKEKTDAEEDSK